MINAVTKATIIGIITDVAINLMKHQRQFYSGEFLYESGGIENTMIPFQDKPSSVR